jgi:antitoxin component of MazEF toxin-antitoxin module
MTYNMRVRGRIRRIGNSLGVVIQSEAAKSGGLSVGDEVELEVTRRVAVKELFGALRFAKSSQRIKNESRRDWGE